MKRALALPCVAAAFVVACQESDTQMPIVERPSALVVDGAHGTGGNPAFFFLPPLVANPSNTLFGEFDRDAIPTIEICELSEAEGSCDAIVKVVNPAEITGRSDHFLYGLDMSSLTTNNPNDEEFFRINVLIGNTAAGIVAELGSRDIAVNYPLCGDETASILCVSQDANVTIKFRVDKGAMCFTPGVGIEPLCASTTVVGATPSTATVTDPTTQEVSATITAPGIADPTLVGDRYALRFQEVPFEECDLGALELGQELGLDDGGFRPMQWAQFPVCYRGFTATESGADVDINEVVNGLAAYTIYFDHVGPSPFSTDLLRLARMSDNRQELQILARSDLPAPGGQSEAPSLGTRLWQFARGLIDGTLFAPKRVYASASGLLVRDAGIGGLAGKSIIGVVYPASLTADGVVMDTVDLGIVSPGASFGPEDGLEVFAVDVDNGYVQNNDVTFTPGNGDTFNGSTGSTDVRSDATGAAGGTWTIAAGASGVRTLNASCFPCSDPPVTGDNRSDATDENDPMWHYDNLFPFSAHRPQTITFKAVVLSLSVDPLPPRGIVSVDFPVTVCIGADVDGVEIQFAGRANNGEPTEVTPNSVTTGAGIPSDGNGCYTVMLRVSKEGGLRVVVSIPGTNLVVETTKINIRPS